MKMITRPDSILVTMSKQNIAEWGGLETLDRFFKVHYSGENDNTFWYKVGKNLPIHRDLLYVYLVLENEIRWRFNLVCFEECPDGVELYKNGKPTIFKGNFVVVSGPLIKAPERFPFKGFQGFRYSGVIY